MPDYQRGKIYKITSGDLNYIGSTCEPTLARRLSTHTTNYRRWKDGKNGYTTSFQVLELGNHEITLIELCPCGSKDELTARERYWIETFPCVNKYIPGRTITEYNETHREYYNEWKRKYNNDHKEQKKKYNEEHKEEIKEQRKNFRETHKEELKEEKKAYYQANKEKISKANKEKRVEKSKLILE